MTEAEAEELETAQASLLKVEKALSSGASFVSFSDRSTSIRSVEQLERAAAYWRSRIATLSSSDGRRSKQLLGYSSKGF